MAKDYYVYIYYRLDTNEPFYVGKGKDDRWKRTDGKHRSKHFKNIMNKYPIVCEIVKDNLTEEQALGIECLLIHELVFEYGYSIDILNNGSIEKGCHLVNATWGGDGVSIGNMRAYKTDEELKEIDKKISRTKIEKGISKGINNGKARKFILKFNDIDLTPILTKKQMRDFLKIGAKSLEQILNNNGVIDKNMFTANNRSKIISYFNKCVIVELDNESSFFYANNKEVE